MVRRTRKKLTVTRKAFTTKRGTRVKAVTFKIKDVGRVGRTPKARRVIPPLTKGALGVSFKDSASVRRKQEIKLAKRIGEKSVVGKLRAIQVFNKNTNPKLSEKARADARFIAGSFKGKKFVGKSKGFA